ncbi:hypothetical protein LCGC14_0264500 [marine sediment metagenome]|uniref:Uncharacterized protein n=1 Tax=marine sediment metagenome TaxID=412755 RepID=A0A0F9X5Q5_9ZZZZ
MNENKRIKRLTSWQESDTDDMHWPTLLITGFVVAVGMACAFALGAG